MEDILGFEGLYAVSKDGKVWSYKSKRFLTPQDNGKGYLFVDLYKDGKRNKRRINRLVAEAYIKNPDPEKYNQVGHKDENRTNNCVENLYWTNAKENCNYGEHNKKLSQSMKDYMSNPKHRENISKKLSKPVFCEELNTVFESGVAAAAQLGLNQSNISNCCNGRIQTTGKMHFHFATDEEIMKYKLKQSFDELTKAVVEEARMERMGLGYNVPGLLESAC